MNINKYICTGRLTKDPELLRVSDDMKVCQLRLAVDGLGRGREIGYVNVAVFGKAGEACAEYLSKGWLVAVDGRLGCRSAPSGRVDSSPDDGRPPTERYTQPPTSRPLCSSNNDAASLARRRHSTPAPHRSPTATAIAPMSSEARKLRR